MYKRQTLRDAVTLAVAETDETHGRMTELFHTKHGVEVTLIDLLGKLFYLELHKPKEAVSRADLGFESAADVSLVGRSRDGSMTPRPTEQPTLATPALQ